MKKNIEKSAGLSLLIGLFFMFITMVLHPTGGSLEHILEIKVIAIVSHSIALLSIPFVGFGFWGISYRLRESNFLSFLSFSMVITGLMAVMIAAALNGLVLPMMAQAYADAAPETMEGLRPLFRYNMMLNHAFDYIFMASWCGGILLWSISILKTRAFPAYLSWLGLLVSLGMIFTWISGFILVDLHGFRIFIFGNLIWFVIAGVLMLRSNSRTNKQ